MNRKSYKLLALVFVFALVFGTFASMVPAPAQASDMAGQPPHGRWMHGGKAYFKPNKLPNPFVRDFDGRQPWWGYELHHGRYVRKYSPKKYGDEEQSYRKNVHSLWAGYKVPDTLP